MVPILLQHGFSIVSPAHRRTASSLEEHQKNRKGDIGRGDVWDLIASAHDWKRRTGSDRPLVMFAFTRGDLFSLIALAQERHLWGGAVLMAPMSSIETINRLSSWPLPDDPREREKALTERSPIEQAHKIRVPVRMFHGGRDQISNVDDVHEIQRRIEAGGGECTLTVYEQDGHLLAGHRDEIVAETLEFLRRFE